MHRCRRALTSTPIWNMLWRLSIRYRDMRVRVSFAKWRHSITVRDIRASCNWSNSSRMMRNSIWCLRKSTAAHCWRASRRTSVSPSTKRPRLLRRLHPDWIFYIRRALLIAISSRRIFCALKPIHCAPLKFVISIWVPASNSPRISHRQQQRLNYWHQWVTNCVIICWLWFVMLSLIAGRQRRVHGARSSRSVCGRGQLLR